MAPSRREEIKKKQELQARFQFSMAQNNARALNWLKPATSNHNQASSSETTQDGRSDSTKQNDDDNENDFMKLRVIPQGSGLSSKTTQTVGDFLNSKDITQQKTNDGSNVTDSNKQVGRGNGRGSVAMNALLNKMRNETRKELNQSSQVQQGKAKKEKKTNSRSAGSGMKQASSSAKANAVRSTGSDSDDEEDDDIKALKSRSVGKLGGHGKVGKKARPF